MSDSDIANLEWRVVEAAVGAQPTMKSDVLDGYAEFADLLEAVDALIDARKAAEPVLTTKEPE